MLDIGARKSKAHHVCADDHRKPHALEEACKDKRKTKSHRGNHGWRAESLLEECGNLARSENADNCGEKPNAKRFNSHKTDMTPIHPTACATRICGGEVGRDDAVADSQDHKTEDIVNNGASHNRGTFLGIELLALGENARRNTH